MPNNDFELKLQLHADGEAAAPAADGGAPAAEVSTAADNGGADYTGDTAGSESNGKTYAIEVDPRTNRRKVVMLAGKEPEPAQQDNAAPAQQTEPQPAAPQQAEDKPEVPAQQYSSKHRQRRCLQTRSSSRKCRSRIRIWRKLWTLSALIPLTQGVFLWNLPGSMRRLEMQCLHSRTWHEIPQSITLIRNKLHRQ